MRKRTLLLLALVFLAAHSALGAERFRVAGSAVYEWSGYVDDFGGKTEAWSIEGVDQLGRRLEVSAGLGSMEGYQGTHTVNLAVVGGTTAAADRDKLFPEGEPFHWDRISYPSVRLDGAEIVNARVEGSWLITGPEFDTPIRPRQVPESAAAPHGYAAVSGRLRKIPVDFVADLQV